MESPAGFPDSPMEQDDASYPCKGCGEILEEGKAFELAGNRWHIDCFRCNTCGTLLDSDANLLLLGDGSLICNNCTYSCSACGNKIEDLAILTGDQAFCATCFKCRNCKKKIENLKYARTSQGIFCMECHESLMQRRRKKYQKGTSSRTRHQHLTPPSQNSNSSMLLHKSLPSLPPNAASRETLPPEGEIPSDGYSDTPTELPRPTQKRPSESSPSSYVGSPAEPPPRVNSHRSQNSTAEVSRGIQREASVSMRTGERRDNLGLPPSTDYQSNRHSAISDVSGNGDAFFIPMALDPNPIPGPPPEPSQQPENIKPHRGDVTPHPRDYFTSKRSDSVSRKPVPEHHHSRSTAVVESPQSRHSSGPSSPHIAYQEIGRDPSYDHGELHRKRRDHSLNSTKAGTAASSGRSEPTRTPSQRSTEMSNGNFILQEVPKNRRSGVTPRHGTPDSTSPEEDQMALLNKSRPPPDLGGTRITEQQANVPASDILPAPHSDTVLDAPPQPSIASRGLESEAKDSSSSSSPSTSSPSSNQITLPRRGDSLQPSATALSKSARGDRRAPSGSKLSTNLITDELRNDTAASAPPSTTAQHPSVSLANTNGLRSLPRTSESKEPDTTDDFPPPPPRARERIPPSLVPGLRPRTPPAPKVPSNLPLENHKVRNASVSTISSHPGDPPVSPKLPRYSAGGDFTMDEDMARIMGLEGRQDHESFLRKVSNSVRHTRSYSDRGARLSKEQKWPKSPLRPSSRQAQDISSPAASSPETREELSWFKNELRRERQRSAEQGQRLHELEAALEAKSNIKKMNSELKEKRSTMVVLDTQKEIVIRELEVLTEHIANSKRSREPLDIGSMSNIVIRDFAQSLQNLKESFQPQIEQLTQQRNELVDEVSNITEMKDKSFQQFEQLSEKNADLANLNNQLVHQIQELYKANAGPSFDNVRAPPSGLGIYNHHPKERSNVSIDARPSVAESNISGSTMYPEGSEHEAQQPAAAMLGAPQVVNIRKAQPKKFNWKKGGHNVAKGVKSGLKGAFSSNDRSRDGPQASGGAVFTEGVPYGSTTLGQQPEYTLGNVSKSQPHGQDRQGFGFFSSGQNKTKDKPSTPLRNGSISAPIPEGPATLFGSDLEARCAYEGVSIPGIVTRCIEEVELRGMDIEGIYRKSGGSAQTQLVKEGFETSFENGFDLADPDLDINAVTSCLKQYFRKLPTPLITFEVYDTLIENFPANPRGDKGQAGAAPPSSSSNNPNPLDSSSTPSAPPSTNNNNTTNNPTTSTTSSSPPSIDASKIPIIRSAISTLPPSHRDTLEFLCFHLKRVVSREKENLMTAMNIAVVFAPTVMRPESLVREMSETQEKMRAVRFLVEWCDRGIFER